MEGCFSRAAIANDALRRRIAGVQRTALCCEREGSAVPASVLSSIPSPARLCQSKVFSRHHRGAHGSAGGRARAQWNHLSLMMVVWENETRRDEGNATYCQTSNPSLSNSTSTTSEDKWKCVVRVWGGEGEGEGAGRAGDVCSSVRRHPRRPCATQGFPRRKPQMHATPRHRRPEVGVSPVCFLSRSFLFAPSHCMTRGSWRCPLVFSPAVWLQRVRSGLVSNFQPARLPPQRAAFSA